MSSIYQEIRQTLESNLLAIWGLPEVAYENFEFSPTTGTPFVSISLIPISRLPATRGLNPQQRYEVTFRIDVVYPTGNGPGDAEAMADTILEAFDSTTDLTGNSIILSISNSDRGAGVVDTPWYIIPLSINCYIYEA